MNHPNDTKPTLKDVVTGTPQGLAAAQQAMEDSMKVQNDTSQAMEVCNHTLGPEGYVQRLEWLERISKQYKQIQCSNCGLWAIWRKK